MKDITELFNKTKKYKNVVLQRRLKSKKNTVAYVILDGKPRILKWFAPGFKRQMEVEKYIITKGSSNLKIPFLYDLDYENNVMIMNYISGENLCDIINNNISFDENKRLMKLLADWFKQFHLFFKQEDNFYIHGDSILQNFLLSDNIWGVDFEESRLGNPIEDIATICSSIISTNPMFTYEKFRLCEEFILSYDKIVKWDIANIIEEIVNSLLNMMIRRGHNFSLKEANKIVNNINI
jgi:tRNA A-37 threonylcarbamoyl transferase component Bud32